APPRGAAAALRSVQPEPRGGDPTRQPHPRERRGPDDERARQRRPARASRARFRSERPALLRDSQALTPIRTRDAKVNLLLVIRRIVLCDPLCPRCPLW